MKKCYSLPQTNMLEVTAIQMICSSVNGTVSGGDNEEVSDFD